MRKFFTILTVAVAACTLSCKDNGSSNHNGDGDKTKSIVILSTNDMHARIDQFPQLATAVQQCRDTTDMVLLVDAGDRWTGNAYVDMAEVAGLPIIELMNRLGYDAATFGNHEFDHGAPHLGEIAAKCDFKLVGANILSENPAFHTPEPYVILECGGVKIGFVGVITNYEGGGYPAGNASSYEGLTFPDPQQQARKYAAELRDKSDVLVLLSHMGDDRDEEMISAEGGVPYDVIIGGHTHVVRDTLINNTLLTQTGKNIRNVGVTTLRMDGRKLVSADFELRPISDFAPDSTYAAEVARYYDNEELNRPVGELPATLDKVGLANWMAGASGRATDSEVSLYHIGGVRLDAIEKGGVSTARIYDLEPFSSHVAVARMTPAQLRKMILTKYNDTENRKESHRVDLYSTTPYTIITDKDDNATDVRFPTLEEGRTYRVAISDYAFKNYRDVEYSEGAISDVLVTEALLGELRSGKPVQENNTPLQSVAVE